MTTRQRLSNRRRAGHFTFQSGTLTYTGTVGFFDDGQVGEIFLNSGKSGTHADVCARDGAVAVSLALQYGVPLDVLKHALTRNPDGSASGPIGQLLDMV